MSDKDSNNFSDEDNPKKEYEILKEEDLEHDISFKVILIGNSSKFIK